MLSGLSSVRAETEPALLALLALSNAAAAVFGRAEVHPGTGMSSLGMVKRELRELLAEPVLRALLLALSEAPAALERPLETAGWEPGAAMLSLGTTAAAFGGSVAPLCAGSAIAA